MIKAVIIEDEPRNMRMLGKMLETYCPNISLSGHANNVESALVLIQRIQPELVFLDIEMPGGNAFVLLDKLRPVNFEIIFVTAYDNYSLKAIKYSALDYLLKPVNIPELIAAVNKVAEKLQGHQIEQQIETLLQNMARPKKGFSSIAIPARFGCVFVETSNIIRCEAAGPYTHIFLNDGEKVISTKNLKEYEEILSTDIFFRIHHSHIINVHHIKRFHKGKNAVIKMSDKTEIPISQRRKNEFLSYFNIEG